MKKEINLSIQKQLLELTNIKFSRKYISKFIIPIIEYIATSQKKKFLIGGSQGIGKTTLLKVIKKNIKTYYDKNVFTLSLDDYYLTKNERLILSKNIHPLLITRGVPGTHNIKQLIKDIKKFENYKYPIRTPIFDKLIDDRLMKKKIEYLKSDILILEGWCCGSAHINNEYLLKNLNKLEKNNDFNLVWRKYYNNKLKYEYKILFKMFDSKIFFKAPSFTYILNWKLKQERMNKSNSKLQKKMNKKNIIYFIQHYEKITKWMFKTLIKKANVVIKVNKNQKIFSIFYKKIY